MFLGKMMNSGLSNVLYTETELSIKENVNLSYTLDLPKAND